MSAEILTALLSIIVIDLVVSGDNAIVIGMAAHRLPPRQRRIAILVGGGAAIFLRVVLTSVATLLLTLPYLKDVGGLLLVGIAFKLLKEEEEGAEGVKVAVTLRGAIATILIADFIMSLDNILAVAAAAKGNIPLLLFGLGFSMAIMMVGGTLAANLINRYWWLVYVGSGVIAFVGWEMILEEPLLEHVVPMTPEIEKLVAVIATMAVLALAHYWHRHRPARRRALARQSEQ